MRLMEIFKLIFACQKDTKVNNIECFHSTTCCVSAGSSTDYEPVCGRPHGIRLDRHGQLIVADSYFGLHSVDPKTGEKTLLLANSEGTECASCAPHAV